MMRVRDISVMFLSGALIVQFAAAQSLQQFAYQAVVRDNNNQLVSNRTIGMRVSILKDSTNGQSAYTETHTPKTNQQGIVQLNIGGGTVVSGSFTSMPWSSGKLFVRTEMDLQGGTNYTISGTTQLLSVPYALYSSDVPVSKSGDTVTIGTSKLIIPGSQLLPGTAPASLSNGLVAYYPFNGNANDESGNGNHGTVNGATLTNDKFGNISKAYSFTSGTLSEIYVQNLTINDDWTISLWFNPSFPIPINQNYLIGINCSGYYAGIGITGNNPSCNLSQLTSFIFDGQQGCSNWSESNTKFKLNQYQNLIVVRHDNQYKIYLQGGLVSNSYMISDININRVNFGRRCQDPLSNTFQGQLDDIRIYNRALTQEEITYLANN